VGVFLGNIVNKAALLNFEYTDEQRMIKDSARRLMCREVVPYLSRFADGRNMSLPEIKVLLKKLIPLGYGLRACRR